MHDWKKFLFTISIWRKLKIVANNNFLPERLAKLPGVATQDQTLSNVEMVAVYEVKPWYLWNEKKMLLTNIRYELLFVFETTLFLNRF